MRGLAHLIIFIKGIVFFFIGIVITAMGLPASETDAALQVGDKSADSFEQIDNSEPTQQAVSNFRSTLVIIGVGAMIIGILEIFLPLISFAKANNIL